MRANPRTAWRCAVAVGMLATVAIAACAEQQRKVSLDEAAARGRRLTVTKGCTACHSSMDSDASIGPSWWGSWGTEVTLDDGTTVTFDATYVTNSVRTPDLQRRPGNWVRMPAFRDIQVSDAELADIVAYLTALGDA